MDDLRRRKKGKRGVEGSRCDPFKLDPYNLERNSREREFVEERVMLYVVCCLK